MKKTIELDDFSNKKHSDIELTGRTDKTEPFITEEDKERDVKN